MAEPLSPVVWLLETAAGGVLGNRADALVAGVVRAGLRALAAPAPQRDPGADALGRAARRAYLQATRLTLQACLARHARTRWDQARDGLAGGTPLPIRWLETRIADIAAELDALAAGTAPPPPFQLADAPLLAAPATGTPERMAELRAALTAHVLAELAGDHRPPLVAAMIRDGWEEAGRRRDWFALLQGFFAEALQTDAAAAAAFSTHILAGLATALQVPPADVAAQWQAYASTVREDIAGLRARMEEQHQTVLAELRALAQGHDQILAGVGDLRAGQQELLERVRPPSAGPPWEIPTPPGDFVGRAEAIAELEGTLRRGGGAVAAICGVQGMGGIGKSSLAAHVAHRLRAAFPDGGVSIDLRGASTSPLSPAAALQAAIRAFDREARLPEDVDALAKLYRTRLAGRRVLVLADDARDDAQVTPLVPPPGSALLVTSRARIVLPAMVPIELGLLAPEEAEALLRTICPRIGEHAATLAARCGRLPLALRISASLLRAQRTRPVPAYLEQLAQARLAHLVYPDRPDDPRASVAASIQLSYAALDAATQQALAQLSVFVADFDRAAAQAVLALPEGRAAEAAIEALDRLCLLDYDAERGRLGLHELVRAFARPQLADARAPLRYARHYAQEAARADALLREGGERMLAGLAWFDQERAHVEAGWDTALQLAGEPEADAVVVTYSAQTTNLGNLRDWTSAREERLRASLPAARRQGDTLGEANTLLAIGDVQQFRKETDAALVSYHAALALFRQTGDRQGEANTVKAIGDVQQFRDEYDAALVSYHAALALFRQTGDRLGEANTLRAIGDVQQFRKETDAALVSYHAALALFRQTGSRLGEANTVKAIGDVQQFRDEYDAALVSYHAALALFRQTGDRLGEANTLRAIGDVQQFRTETDAALASYHAALALFRQTGDRLGEANVLAAQSRLLIDADPVRSRELLDAALKLRRAIDDSYGMGADLGNYGIALLRRGRSAEAIDYLERARELFASRGIEQYAQLMDEMLAQARGALDASAGDPPAAPA